MIISPIWRDTYFTTTLNTLVYEIRLDGNVIYSGKAVRFPDADELRININKICQNYLEEDIVQFLSNGDRQVHSQGQRVFSLWSNGYNLENYMFYYDYSYDYSKDIEGNVITSNPINGHYTDGMLKPKTIRISTQNSNQMYTDNDSTDYAVQGCGNYVLYYLNSYGGWDAFLIEGNVSKKDNINSFSIDRSFNNTSLDFENKRYISEIKTSYELNTGLLDDEQSANLAKNLMGSNMVYMHDLKEGMISPVVITDKNISYSKYINNIKMNSYKINIELSQSKVRR